MATGNSVRPEQSQDIRHRLSEDRYSVSAPVRFKWQTASGDWRFGNGVTRDISSSGVFVLAYPVPVPDASLLLTIELPSPSASKTPIRFFGRGRVVRVEPQDGHPIGFGAVVAFEDWQDDWGPARSSPDHQQSLSLQWWAAQGL